MENKVYLKKYLVITLSVSIILFAVFLIANIYEYNSYNSNFNRKIQAIVSSVKETYPDVSDEEIIEILNSEKEDTSDSEFLEKYGIFAKQDSILLENEKDYHRFLILNCGFFVVICAILLFIFLKYDSRKDREIRKITKYIEEINKKNYSLEIDEISEDELSILKNEIYKTTIMLKESADNSLKDKKELKKSLEDISHQLKTPLTSILIILDNIIDNPDMDRGTRDDFVRDIKREVTKISFLVQSLLKLSKFDSNTINFVKEERFIKDIVDESINNIWSLCDLKNIRINRIGDEFSKIKCDFMWQVEAITNIIKNAVEHSNENSKIDIGYEQNKVYSSIEIINYDSKIDEDDLPHIFERFYKGKNATENSIGIGLALSKAIIEEDNGTIFVESNDRNTKFIIKYFEN